MPLWLLQQVYKKESNLRTSLPFSHKKIQTFEESGLRFHFHPDCFVMAFDKHRFYKTLSGKGLKGIDFLILDAEGYLHFLEVKNYRTFGNAEDVKLDVSAIQHLMELKLKGTLKVISVANALYERRWWFRLVSAYWGQWPWWARLMPEAYLWWRFQRVVEEGNYKAYLWLEGEELIDEEELEGVIVLNRGDLGENGACIVGVDDQ